MFANWCSDFKRDGRAGTLAVTLSFLAVFPYDLKAQGGTLVGWGRANVATPPVSFSNVTVLAPGQDHSVVGLADGRFYAWGFSGFGQTNLPPYFSNLLTASSGAFHNLGLGRDQRVVPWMGSADTDGRTNIPPNLTNVVEVVGAARDSVALRSDGTVVAWGTSANNSTNVPAGLSNVIAIAGQFFHHLALKADGTVVAWGQYSNVPPDVTNCVAIAAGNTHSLALRRNGTVKSWGDNTYGQLNVPPGLSNVAAITAGQHFSVALRSNGTVVAWGINNVGQTNVPPGLSNVVAIAAGWSHTLALMGDRWNVPMLSDAEHTNQTFRAVTTTREGKRFILECKEDVAGTNWMTCDEVRGYGFGVRRELSDKEAASAKRVYRVVERDF